MFFQCKLNNVIHVSGIVEYRGVSPRRAVPGSSTTDPVLWFSNYDAVRDIDISDSWHA